MQGLSFREYLNLFHGFDFPVLSFEDILALKMDIPSGFHPFEYFPEYLRQGYYPFPHDDFDTRLMQMVNLSIETDIPQYAGMNISTARKLKRLLAVIARSVPFKPNISTLATVLNVSRNSVADYCLYLEEAGLIAQLRDDTGGIRGLGKVDKIYLDNTNLIHALGRESADTTFEVGGRKKGQKQIEGLIRGYVVKDEIEYGHGNVIPLWMFGFGY